jgi:hypothetical protein
VHANGYHIEPWQRPTFRSGRARRAALTAARSTSNLRAAASSLALPEGASMKRHNRKVLRNGAPQIWTGVNFWSRTGGPLMWRYYDPVILREELDAMRAHGMSLTRSFFCWPDFMPSPDRLDEQLLGHFRDFLDAHSERGMTSIPTFLVGHMSGQNWDPARRGDRDLFEDVWLVARQAWYVRELTARFAEHPAVVAWLLTNEVPIYGDWRSRSGGRGGRARRERGRSARRGRGVGARGRAALRVVHQHAGHCAAL